MFGGEVLGLGYYQRLGGLERMVYVLYTCNIGYQEQPHSLGSTCTYHGGRVNLNYAFHILPVSLKTVIPQPNYPHTP